MRTIALILAVALAGSTFTDIGDSIHREDIKAIAARNITQGCNPPANTLYCPENEVTRGQMAKFIRRAGGFPLRTGLPDQFPDIASSVFRDEINSVGSIVDGIGVTNNFRPDWPLSRIVMVRWMFKAGWCGNSIANVQVFDDVSPDDPILGPDVPYLWACWKTGIAKGHEGSFFPHEGVTRAQMASFITRATG